MTTDVAASGTGFDYANAVVIQGDGKIVVAGTAQEYITGFDFALARYNADGSLDATFGTSGLVTTDLSGGGDYVYSLALGVAGEIVAAGQAGDFNFAVARYNANGSLDTTFNGAGYATTAFGSTAAGFGVALQGDGKIVVAGTDNTSGSGDFALARYNADGSLDTTFDTDGKVTTDFAGGADVARGVFVQPNGKIVAAGYAVNSTTHYDFALARYTGTTASGKLQFSSSTATVNENGGTVTIKVTRTGGSEGTVGVQYATSDGTARAGSDYIAVSGMLTFNDGETSKTFTIPIRNDSLAEGNETVHLTLRNPIGGAALAGLTSELLTIRDTSVPKFAVQVVRQKRGFRVVITDGTVRKRASTAPSRARYRCCTRI